MQVTPYLGYSSLKDFFPTMRLRPNESCTNSVCREVQSKKAHLDPVVQSTAAEPEDSLPTHEDNEWGIEVECAHAVQSPMLLSPFSCSMLMVIARAKASERRLALSLLDPTHFQMMHAKESLYQPVVFKRYVVLILIELCWLSWHALSTVRVCRSGLTGTFIFCPRHTFSQSLCSCTKAC